MGRRRPASALSASSSVQLHPSSAPLSHIFMHAPIMPASKRMPLPDDEDDDEESSSSSSESDSEESSEFSSNDEEDESSEESDFRYEPKEYGFSDSNESQSTESTMDSADYSDSSSYEGDSFGGTSEEGSLDDSSEEAGSEASSSENESGSESEDDDLKKAHKKGKKQMFKSESKLDPAFFGYLTLMHEWHEMDGAAQKKALKAEKAAEMEASLYNVSDGVKLGMKLLWDLIQHEIDILPLSRRLSSPLKFRKLMEYCMELEHTGRMRRMILMERGILFTILHMLHAINGKFISPPSRCSLRGVGASACASASNTPAPMEGIAEEECEEMESDVAPPPKLTNARNSHATVTQKRHASQTDDQQDEAENDQTDPTSMREMPLRTRSSLRRSISKAARPTTFTNIPPALSHSQQPSQESRRGKSDEQHTTDISAAALASHSRSASAPPIDLNANEFISPTKPSRKRRTPGSNETRSTIHMNGRQTQHTPATAAGGSGSSKRILKKSTSHSNLSHHRSTPTNRALSFSTPSPSVGAAAAAAATSHSPFPTSPFPSNMQSPHREWIDSLIKHRDDLHLLMISLIFMAFVHVTDSEKLASMKKQMLTALLHHAEWGRQKIQAQIHKMLRVPTVSSSSTSGAAAFSQASSPSSPAHHGLARTASGHSLSPNSLMIYQFDAICLDLIARDILPPLRDKLPDKEELGEEEAHQLAIEQIEADALRYTQELEKLQAAEHEAEEAEHRRQQREANEGEGVEAEEDEGEQKSESNFMEDVLDEGDDEPLETQHSDIGEAPRVKKLPKRKQHHHHKHHHGHDADTSKEPTPKKTRGRGVARTEADMSESADRDAMEEESDETMKVDDDGYQQHAVIRPPSAPPAKSSKARKPRAPKRLVASASKHATTSSKKKVNGTVKAASTKTASSIKASSSNKSKPVAKSVQKKAPESTKSKQNAKLPAASAAAKKRASLPAATKQTKPSTNKEKHIDKDKAKPTKKKQVEPKVRVSTRSSRSSSPVPTDHQPKDVGSAPWSSQLANWMSGAWNPFSWVGKNSTQQLISAPSSSSSSERDHTSEEPKLKKQKIAKEAPPRRKGKSL